MEKGEDEKVEKEEDDEKEETEMRLFGTASRSLMCRINIISGSGFSRGRPMLRREGGGDK